MNEKKIIQIILTVFISVALISLLWWSMYDPTRSFIEYGPGLDNKPDSLIQAAENINIGEIFETFSSVIPPESGAWPRFRGANYDNISTDKTRLAEKWDNNTPEILWSKDLGEGHAAPAVMNGRVYLLDYDESQKADLLRCFSLADGQELWHRGYKVQVKRNHGMSRTVPAVTEKYVLTVGPRGHVMCVTADSGAFRWGLDLEKEFEAQTPFWYTGQCPLIDDSLAVLAPGGRALMIGVHCETGKIIWETPNPNKWQMSHSSIMPMTLFGKKMYVYPAVGGVFAVSASGEDRGQVLWESNRWNHSVIAPSALHVGNGKIFLTAGYAAGCMVLQVKFENGQFSASVIQELKPGEGMASEQQTPIFYQDHVFMILPKDAGTLRNQFVCCSPEDFSKIRWSSGKETRFGLGPYMIGDGKFFILDDEGTLTMARATTRGYEELAQKKILDGHDAWGPLALVNGRLLLRDSKRLVCLDVHAK
ncbi:PQQ-binding-like beta-propeller repeat protein [candidate division KSB1 bacterium]|nr:PQQ-binding-like beta-propeller repeat protein [candidate division KSB1 bacterium]